MIVGNVYIHTKYITQFNKMLLLYSVQTHKFDILSIIISISIVFYRIKGYFYVDIVGLHIIKNRTCIQMVRRQTPTCTCAMVEDTIFIDLLH